MRGRGGAVGRGGGPVNRAVLFSASKAQSTVALTIEQGEVILPLWRPNACSPSLSPLQEQSCFRWLLLLSRRTPDRRSLLHSLLSFLDKASASVSGAHLPDGFCG